MERSCQWRDDIAVVAGSEIRQKHWDKGRNYLLTGAGFYFFASGSGMLMDKSSGENKKIISWDGVEVKSTEKNKPKPEGFGIGESTQKELTLQVGEA